MQKCFNQNKNLEEQIQFLTEKGTGIQAVVKAPVLPPFSEIVIDFLNEVSKKLLSEKEAKQYPDIVTWAFWIRKASVLTYKERFCGTLKENEVCLGRGIVFHIAPSNVPVNYAYSLTTGLLTGNKNIVRVSSKEFRQVQLINQAINQVLQSYHELIPYIMIVKYAHSREISDYFSSVADVRVIWGGDTTISEIRKSPLPVRAREITFADRYSLTVIDSDYYLEKEDIKKIAQGFYNDTYMTDQNACTSPKIVIWTGNAVCEAKRKFWDALYQLVEKQYDIQSVQAVDKLAKMYLAASECECCQVKEFDNRLVRIELKKLQPSVLKYLGNSGYFYEYSCNNIMELSDIICDKCQTVGYIGKKEFIRPLLEAGMDGIDRVVPVGKTMDFDFIWDGYNLFAEMTRLSCLI